MFKFPSGGSIWTPPTITLADSIRLGKLIRADLARLKPGEIYNAPLGVADFGTENLIIKDNEIRGHGPNYTKWLCATQAFGPGCCFELSNRSILKGLTLNANLPLDAQGETVGFSRTGPGATFGGYLGNPALGIPAGPVSNATAWLEDCDLIGRGWVVYSCSGLNNTLNLLRCKITGARWLVCNYTSSSGESGFINLDLCTLKGDSRLSSYFGQVGQRLQAFVGRGGAMKITRCDVTLDAYPLKDGYNILQPLESCNGAWNDPLGHPDSSIELEYTKFKINFPDLARIPKEWSDINKKFGKVSHSFCLGSNEDKTPKVLLA